MNKLLLSVVGLVAMATSASAADMAARPYTKAAPVAAPYLYDWSGFYIGANGGYGTERKCYDITTAAGTFISAEGCHDANGAVAGGQIGYRWQSAGWVFGLEAQGDWANLRGSNVSLATGGLTTNRSRLDAFGLFTGQIGYSWNNALLYVKGGGAVTSNRYDTYFVPTGALIGSSRDESRFGGTVGVGLEYGFTPNWSFAVEYDHLFINSRNYLFTTPAGATLGFDRIRGDVDLITARVNYRFGGPVVARY